MNEAARLAERYAAGAREAGGSDSPEYATAITWLAFVYEQQQRKAEAEPLLRQAIEIREEVLRRKPPARGH